MTSVRSFGFTLIELLIALAVVGILTAITVPIYREYVVRSQMIELMTQVLPLRSDVEFQYAMNQTVLTMPQQNWDTNFVRTIHIGEYPSGHAWISVYPQNIYDGWNTNQVLVFQSNHLDSEFITWQCCTHFTVVHQIPERFNPPQCTKICQQ